MPRVTEPERDVDRSSTSTVASRITLKPATTAWVLGATAALLILTSLAAQLTKYLIRPTRGHSIISLVNVDEETIPSYFSASMMLFAAAVVAVIAVLRWRARGPLARSWGVLAACFVLMSVDEAVGVHEVVLDRVTRLLLGQPTLGVFHFPWVIPGIVVATCFMLGFRRFFRHLPPATKGQVLLAAVLFIGGAIGLELVGAQYITFYGTENLTYNLIATLEESMEMAGIIVFIYAMLKLIEDEYGEVRFRIGDPSGTSGERTDGPS